MMLYKFISHKIVGLLIFLIIIMPSLSCQKTPQPPDWGNCSKNELDDLNTAIPTSDHLVVYIDTSASMSGFISENKTISEDNQTIFSKTLLELRTSATSLNNQTQVVVKEVSSTVKPPSFGDLSITKSLQKNIYNGNETNLAAALQSFSTPINESKNSNPAMINILVTDGIQSTKDENQETDCATGSDWYCVRKKIKELIDKGWKGSVLGIRSEFSGHIYSEVSGAKIPYATGKDVKKFRPFYLYVFSPNPKIQQELILLLKRKLSQIALENSLGDKDVFREFPLTPAFVDGQVSSSFNIAQEDKSLLDVRQNNGEKNQFDVLVNTQTESKGEKKFDIKLTIPWSQQTKDTEDQEGLKKLIVWKLEQISSGENEKYRYPELTLSNPPTISGNELLFNFKTGWKRGIGTKAWRLYRLVGKIDTEKTPSWINDWSTNLDTTSSMGNRTLNLASSLATLWNNKSANEYVIAKVCFRVGEK